MCFKGQKSIFSQIFFNILDELFYSNFWHIKEQNFMKFSMKNIENSAVESWFSDTPQKKVSSR